MIGQTLSHFKITAKLGEGGMGEVYLAEDTKLGREVAIKVLPLMFVDDPERMARFEREAQLLASLNHPNIASIHGLDEDEGHHFLVLELIEGDTLQGLMERGPIKREQSLKIALQIAKALEAAHEKGIVHRDLKPANIKIMSEGQVKVLDFGLAKVWQPEASSNPSLSISPTMTAQMTQAGVILGTAAYMSPEQARGLAVDTRADIWAFGVILYEMLSSASAFRGETVTDLIAAVVTTEPDPERLPGDLPERLRSLLSRCLNKNPQKRLRDIGDARIDIQEVMDAPYEAPAARAGARPRPLATIVATALIAAVLGGGAARWWAAPTDAGHAPTARFEFDVPVPLDISGVPNVRLAISPDGGRMVFSLNDSGTPLLYLRELGSFDFRPLPGTEGGWNPFFSPDGESIGFITGREIKRLPLGGGRPVTVTEFEGLVAGATWTEDDRIIFALSFSKLYHVPASGGRAEELRIQDSSISGFAWPQRLPGGEWILVQFAGEYEGRPGPHVGAVSLGTGEARWIRAGIGGQYVYSGHLIWETLDGLHAVPFDVERLEEVGAPATVLEGSGPANFDAPSLAVSESGTTIRSAAAADHSAVLWIDRQGQVETITEVDSGIIGIRLSPDGKQLAFIPAFRLVRVLDLARGSAVTLTPPGGSNVVYVAWTHDGSRVAYGTNRDGPHNIYLRSIDGQGEAERLVASALSDIPRSFSPTDETLLYYRVSPDEGRDIWALRLGEEPHPVLATPANERAPMFSPNGEFFSYVSDRSGQDEVFVRRYPDTGQLWRISPDGGTEPVWRSDGRELFYRVEDRFMAVEVDPTFASEPGRPVLMFEGQFSKDPFGNPNYDVSPDGQRFVVVRGSDAFSSKIRVVMNWFDELRRLAPRG